MCRVHPLPSECKTSFDMLHNDRRLMLLSMRSLLTAAWVRQVYQRQTGSAPEKRLRWSPLGRCPRAACPARCPRRCCSCSRSTSAASPAPGAPAAGERSGWRALWPRPNHKSGFLGALVPRSTVLQLQIKTLSLPLLMRHVGSKPQRRLCERLLHLSLGHSCTGLIDECVAETRPTVVLFFFLLL